MESLVPQARRLPLVPEAHESAITYPRPAELFKSIDKREAIIAAVTRLAAATKATAEPGLLLVYADNLESLPPEALTRAFEIAEDTCRFLPTIPELKQMVGYHTEQLEAVELDRAWKWVQDYLAKHGPGGDSLKVPKFSAEQRRNCQHCGDTGFVVRPTSLGKEQARACECRELEYTPAPSFPPQIDYALRQLANSAKDGLALIAGSTEYPHKQNVYRGQFNEGYKRAKLIAKQ